MTENKKMLIWILIPLVYGLISNHFMLMLHPLLSQVIFVVFWFWVGVKLSTLDGHRFKNFIIGNSLWLISFILFVWQFVLLDDVGRNIPIALFSQHYVLPFIWSGSILTSLFSDVIHSTTVIVVAYVIMLLVNIIGFTVGKLKAK